MMEMADDLLSHRIDCLQTEKRPDFIPSGRVQNGAKLSLYPAAHAIRKAEHPASHEQ
jgi:hypothetical protein